MSTNLPYDEHELLLRVAKGDDAAFRKVFEMLVAPLRYYAYQLIKNNAEAEDMVSLAFHKLWERRERFASLQSLRSFLYIAVRRQCIDLIRHRKVADTARKDLIMAEVTDEGYAEARYMQSELLRIIYGEISTLPEKYRTILEWSFIEELSTAEMASRLQVSEGHVRADRSRALVLLRSALKNKGLLQFATGLYLLWQEQY